MGVRRVRARVEVSDRRGVFMISVAAELADMHPQTLRMYEQRGLIEPQRSPKGTRLYSRADVERLQRISQLTAELGLNLAGVERVFALEKDNERLRGQVEALRQRLAEERAEHAAHVERIRRAARADIVPYDRGGALMSRRDIARLGGSEEGPPDTTPA